MAERFKRPRQYAENVFGQSSASVVGKLCRKSSLRGIRGHIIEYIHIDIHLLNSSPTYNIIVLYFLCLVIYFLFLSYMSYSRLIFIFVYFCLYSCRVFVVPSYMSEACEVGYVVLYHSLFILFKTAIVFLSNICTLLYMYTYILQSLRLPGPRKAEQIMFLWSYI